MNVKEMDELCFIWKAYGKEKDSKLTIDAQELKKAVRAYVKKMPQFVGAFPTVVSQELTPEEIKDVEASEKEIREGKCKLFETTEAFIEDLRKSRKNLVQEKESAK